MPRPFGAGRGGARLLAHPGLMPWKVYVFRLRAGRDPTTEAYVPSALNPLFPLVFV